MDFKIKWMRQTPDGWYYARLLDLHTQSEVAVHDRWGSWMAGEATDPAGSRREVLPLVAAGLQAFKRSNQSKIKKIDPSASPKTANPFLSKKAPKKANPFLAKKKPNPFLSKKKKKKK